MRVWTPLGIEASLSNLVVCQVVLLEFLFLAMVRRSLGGVGGPGGVISIASKRKTYAR